MLDRFGHRDAQQIGRHEDDAKRDEDDQRGDQAILVGERTPESDLKRIQRDREDQRPDHEVEERDEDPETENGQNSNESGTDQDIEQFSGQHPFGNRCEQHNLSPGRSPRGSAGDNPGHARHNGSRNRSMRPRPPTPERSRFIDLLLAHAGRDGYRDRLRVHDLNLISLANILHLLGVLHDHIHRVALRSL